MALTLFIGLWQRSGAWCTSRSTGAALTFPHHVKALADAPGKRFATYEQPGLVDGDRGWRRIAPGSCPVIADHPALRYGCVRRG
ncbi:hypothetical protein IPZ58_34870 [Streptomyces roseoverticillatus]|uniref:hypothetical protein n=1 Tax=Streptomyces roseoverticillatus TaxID=66429 RepID=UPI0035ABA05B|nr:hypothetical protein [Streptomyces roseoverticillatus]